MSGAGDGGRGGVLYLVATPIGNLADWSDRARRTVAEADLVAAEDTRAARRLLSAHDISPRRLVSIRRENERAGSGPVLAALAQGASVAYLAEAGTPGVSDPPARLVRAALDAGYEVRAVPGPSALAAAVSVSGLIEGPFYFAGFLPSKKGARARAIEAALARGEPVVFFESPHRARDFLERIAEAAPARRVVLARELTKYHEEVRAGTAAELLEGLVEKGEFAFVVEGGDEDRSDSAGGMWRLPPFPDTLAEMKPCRVLFVCTGNTCRSPMAEAILAHEAAARGLPIEADSAGTAAVPGATTTEPARRALEAAGIAVPDRRTKPLDAEIIKSADLVVAMEPSHVERIRATAPGVRVPVTILGTYGFPPVDTIADPYGGDDAAYEKTRDEIAYRVRALLRSLAPPRERAEAGK